MNPQSLLKIVACLSLISTSILTTGCLQTRSTQKEQDEKTVLSKQLNSLQQRTADVSQRFIGIEDDIRKIAGRIEANEVKINQLSTKLDRGGVVSESKIREQDTIYREEFAKLHSEIASLRAQIAAMSEEQKRATQAAAAAAQAAAAAAAVQASNPSRSGGKKSVSKNIFDQAEEKFDEKNWQQAIIDYEKYRKSNAGGKNYAAATYKIGVSFQELGMGDEARSFYDEVIEQFPKSKEAERAKIRLRALKKK